MFWGLPHQSADWFAMTEEYRNRAINWKLTQKNRHLAAKNKKKWPLMFCLLTTNIRGHFSELLVSNIYWLTSLSADWHKRFFFWRNSNYFRGNSFVFLFVYMIGRFIRLCLWPSLVFLNLGSFTCTLVSPLCVCIIARKDGFCNMETCTKCMKPIRANCRNCAKWRSVSWQKTFVCDTITMLEQPQGCPIS